MTNCGQVAPDRFRMKKSPRWSVRPLNQTRDGTHWTVRTVAKDSELSRTTVHRIWQAFGLQPHRQRHFKLSTDPFFVEKVRDIAGLYLNPPDKAMVLCVDEKSEIQALDRTQPRLPMGLGYLEGVTHDYVRNGTTTLFCCVGHRQWSGHYRCKNRHRHQEYLQFLNKSMPACHPIWQSIWS